MSHYEKRESLELLRGHISSNEVDILCLFETFLNSNISCDDDNLQLPGLNLLRADHPSNTKREGVCIYYRNFLPLRLITFHYLNEYLTCVIKRSVKISNFANLQLFIFCFLTRLCFVSFKNKTCLFFVLVTNGF